MHHGGDLGQAIATYGGNEEDWLDLSTGINPHSYSIKAADLPESVWQGLPTRRAKCDLMAAARRYYRVPDELGLEAAPGTQILIALMPHLLPLAPLHLLGPTYTSHAEAWRRCGRQVVEHTDIDSWRAAARERTGGPRHLLLVNPNNPDGRHVPPGDLLQVADDLEQHGGHLIVDEAFADIDQPASLLPRLQPSDAPGNGIVLRSFGKFFGLAGLRLGFCAGNQSLCKDLAHHLDSWAVSGPALHIGTRALADTAWQSEMNSRLRSEMAELRSLLLETGLAVEGDTPLYVLSRTIDAADLHAHLARAHIWTRIFDQDPERIRFGLPGSDAGLERLKSALLSFKAGA